MQKKTPESLQRLIDEHQAQIVQWKEKHHTVKGIVVHSKLYGELPFIIAKPHREVMDAVAYYDHTGKIAKIEETLINSCVKAGNSAALWEDLDAKRAVLEKVFELFDKLEVEEKEL